MVTTGPSIKPSEIKAAGNTSVHSYLDHGEILPGTSLVVGHGGHSTVARALCYGIPLLLMPMHALMDQPAVSRAVAAQGAAIVLSKKSDPARIRQAAESLLSEESWRMAAEAIGKSARSADGAGVGVDLIENWLVS
ncbi:MAG: hypothetical protein KF742_04425 [Cryobacterium sp.]|nr:hypothetical protein [Cryobacterium sp.]